MAFLENRFWKHVGLILLAKIMVLAVLWYVFFGPDHAVYPTDRSMQYHLTGTP